ARLAIEAEAPRVAQAFRPDLRRPRRRVGVEAQHGREDRSWILPVALRVAARAAIAQAQPHLAVGPEHEVPAVVVRVGLVLREDDLPRVRALRAETISLDGRVAARVRVARVRDV